MQGIATDDGLVVTLNASPVPQGRYENISIHIDPASGSTQKGKKDVIRLTEESAGLDAEKMLVSTRIYSSSRANLRFLFFFLSTYAFSAVSFTLSET